MHISRRQFGQGLGSSLVLTGLPMGVQAHDGSYEIKVRIEGFGFIPELVEILAGDGVTWTNADIAPHSATATDGTWDTGAIDRGATGRVTFGTPGTYDFICAFHPHMKGRVVVRSKSGS